MTATSIITMMVSAIKTSTMIVSAFMSIAVMPAIVILSMMMTVVVAFCVWIILQCSCSQRLSSIISRSGYATIKLYASLSQRILCSHPNTAADQGIDLRVFQKACQCSMSVAVCRYDLLGNYPAIVYIVQFKLLCVSEMLEDFSILIRYCDSHSVISFLNDISCSLIAEEIIATPDQKSFTVYKHLCHFSTGTFVDGCHSGSGNSHLFCALFLCHPFAIEQPNRLKLVQTHHDSLTA